MQCSEIYVKILIKIYIILMLFQAWGFRWFVILLRWCQEKIMEIGTVSYCSYHVGLEQVDRLKVRGAVLWFAVHNFVFRKVEYLYYSDFGPIKVDHYQEWEFSSTSDHWKRALTLFDYHLSVVLRVLRVCYVWKVCGLWTWAKCSHMTDRGLELSFLWVYLYWVGWGSS